jgi:hypothetical protein
MFSGTAQVSRQVCQFFLSVLCVLVRVTSWCRQVNWGNCGIPWVSCAVLCVKDDCKGQFWGLRYCLSKLRSLLSFPASYDVTSKIAHFNWECIGRLILKDGPCLSKLRSLLSFSVRYDSHSKIARFNWVYSALKDYCFLRYQTTRHNAPDDSNCHRNHYLWHKIVKYKADVNAGC